MILWSIVFSGKNRLSYSCCLAVYSHLSKYASTIPCVAMQLMSSEQRSNWSNPTKKKKKTRHENVFAGLFLQNYFASVEITGGGKEWEWAAETLFLCFKFKDCVMCCCFESLILTSLNFMCIKLYTFNNIPLISQASPCEFGKEARIFVLMRIWCFWQILIEDTCSNLCSRVRTITVLPSWQCSLLGDKRPYCCINEVLLILYIVLICSIILNFGNAFKVTVVTAHVQDQVNLPFKLTT